MGSQLELALSSSVARLIFEYVFWSRCGRRMVRVVSLIVIVSALRIQYVAYVEKRRPRVTSNFSAACTLSRGEGVT